MDDELFKLCKEVYELLPDWHETDGFIGLDGTHLINTEWYDTGICKQLNIAPLYTSDYLLEKLPWMIDVEDKFADDAYLEMKRPGDNVFSFAYESYYYEPYQTYFKSESDTPLKALLKLCISLKEAGKL